MAMELPTCPSWKGTSHRSGEVKGGREGRLFGICSMSKLERNSRRRGEEKGGREGRSFGVCSISKLERDSRTGGRVRSRGELFQSQRGWVSCNCRYGQTVPG